MYSSVPFPRPLTRNVRQRIELRETLWRDMMTVGFVDDMANDFAEFSVVAVNQNDPNPVGVPIAEIVADDSDNEICLVRATNAQTNAGMNLSAFRENLGATIQAHSDYSLMVSEWFEIDNGYTARADLPLKTVELNQAARQFLLLYGPLSPSAA